MRSLIVFGEHSGGMTVSQVEQVKDTESFYPAEAFGI